MNKTIPEPESNFDSSFLNLLQQHRRGEVLNDLADAVRTLTEAVQMTGKPGNLILKIIVTPAGAKGAIIISDDIATKLPQAEKVTSIFFADDNGNLVRTNPNQLEMPLRSIEGGVVDVTSLKKASV